MPHSTPLDLPPGTLLYRRLLSETWNEAEGRPFSNNFALRADETGLSVYVAGLCQEEDVMARSRAGTGLAVLVFDELRDCFDALPSEGEMNPGLQAAHIELRWKTATATQRLPPRKQKQLSKAAAMGLLTRPSVKS